MKLATWNVNSVRAREPRLIAWLAKTSPDVLCLQELKVTDSDFPRAAIEAAGYHIAVHGQKTYNGVAILAKAPLTDVGAGMGDGVDDAQARLLSARVQDVRIVCTYVPNGAEVGSDKWTYKLDWLRRLERYLVRTAKPDEPLIVCGDFNIAPTDLDVAVPADWQDSVLCHRQARQALAAVTSWGLVDVLRALDPEARAYSWWDYRMLAFPKNKGLRLDLIYVTKPLAARCTKAWIDREERKGKLPSDHAPVLVEWTQ